MILETLKTIQGTIPYFLDLTFKYSDIELRMWNFVYTATVKLGYYHN